MSSVETIWTFMVDYTKGWGVQEHTHDYYQMFYCISGRGHMLLNGQDILLEKNRCLLIRPGQTHELSPIESGQFRTIDTKFRIYDETIETALLSAPQLITITDPHFEELQQAMRNEWVSGTLFAKEMTGAQLEQSLLVFLRNNTHVSAKPPFYLALQKSTEKLTGMEKSIADYMSIHFLEDLSLDRISEDLNYSKGYLCKVFKQASGYTINEYINCLRISKAYDLICYTDYRFSEIGAQCGFSSIHYFTRTFRSIVGIPPSQVRNYKQKPINNDIRLHETFHYRYHINGTPHSAEKPTAQE